MQFECPSCQMPVFNRRIEKCGHCGEPLPDSIRLSKEQVAHFDAQLAKEKRQAEAANEHLDRLTDQSRGDAGFMI